MTGFETIETTVCGWVTNRAAAVRTQGYWKEACCHSIGRASGGATRVVMRIMRVQWSALSWIVVCGIYTVSRRGILTTRGDG